MYMDAFGDCSELFDSYDKIDKMASCDFRALMVEFDRQIGVVLDRNSFMLVDDELATGLEILGMPPFISEEKFGETFACESDYPNVVTTSIATDGCAEESIPITQIVIDVSDDATTGSSEYDPICIDVE